MSYLHHRLKQSLNELPQGEAQTSLLFVANDYGEFPREQAARYLESMPRDDLVLAYGHLMRFVAELSTAKYASDVEEAYAGDEYG